MSELRLSRDSLGARSPAALAQALQGLQENSHVILDLRTGSGCAARLRPVPSSEATLLQESMKDSTAVYTVLSAMAASRQHRPLRLSIRGLSAALPEPPAELLELLQESDIIQELQLEDMSIERLAQEGAGNLLRSTSTPPVPAWSMASLHPAQTLLTVPATPINNSAGGAFAFAECSAAHPSSPPQAGAASASDSFDKIQALHPSQFDGHALKTQPQARMPVSDDFRARGTGLLRLAAAMPSLRRLSLRAAVFPAAEVVALAAAVPLLEELSLDGAMEVDTAGPAVAAAVAASKPGAAVSAAAATSATASHVYKGLLAALPRLQLLRLPLPLAAPQQRSELAAATVAHSPFIADPYTVAPGLAAPLPLLYDSDDDDDCYSLASTYGSSISHSGGSSSIFSGWSVAGASAVSTGSGADGAITAHSAAGSCWRTPAIATSSTFAASVHATPKAVAFRAAAEPSDWTFPTRLAELSVPMCGANGPVFFAALNVLGGCGGKAAEAKTEEEEAQEKARRGLRALHVPCPTGYSPWDGAFLKTEQDFAALAGLAPALEVLHLALPPALTAPAAAGLLRACVSHLAKLQDVKELRVSGAKLPACFSVRKLQPAPAEYLAFRTCGTAATGIAASSGASALLPCLVRCPTPTTRTVTEVTSADTPGPMTLTSPAALATPTPLTPVMPPPRRLAPPPSPSPMPCRPATASSPFSSGAAASLFAQFPSGPQPAAGGVAAGALPALGGLPPLPALPPMWLSSPAAASAAPASAGTSAFSCAAELSAGGRAGLLLPLALMSGPSIFAGASAASGRAARSTSARALSFGGLATAAATPAPATPAAAPAAMGTAAGAADATSSESVLLSRLLLQWPRLESVVLLGHSVIRTPAAAAGTGTGSAHRLVSPSSLEELMALRHRAIRGSRVNAKSKSSSGSDDDRADGLVSGASGGGRRTRSLASHFAATTMGAEDAAHRRATKRHRHDRAVAAAAAAAATAGAGSFYPVMDGNTDSDDLGDLPRFSRGRACGCNCDVCGGSSSSASGGSSCGSGDEGDASDAEAAAAAGLQGSPAAAMAKRCNCCA